MNGKVLQLIKPITKKDQVVTMINDAILSGKLEAGAPIVESRIAQDLGVGTPLIREALIELEHQGFVQKFPFKGTYITKLSPIDIEHLFHLRLELEPLAIEWASRKASAADLNELREMVEGMRQGAAEMRLDLFYRNDIAFHRKLWQMTGNTYLADALERLIVPLFAFFLMRKSRDRENYLKSADEHAKMVDDLAAFEAAELRARAKEMMTHWRDEMVARLFAEDQ